MSSITLTLSGNSPHLQAQYFPPIDLSDGDYVCGLVDFQTFNSIPNVDETNNMFYYGVATDNFDDSLTTNQISEKFSDETTKNNKNKKISSIKNPQSLSYIKIPTGSYEVSDLENYIKKELALRKVEFALTANKNTLQCEILCSQPINFTKPNTIGPLLGFKAKRIFAANHTHISRHPADILKISVIRIECDIIKGAYLNNQPAHTIHEFPLKVAPGYKIVETPQNVIYLPITVKNIHALNLSIVDQQNIPINFRGETITARLHIKKV